jgi:hypothetical protein
MHIMAEASESSISLIEQILEGCARLAVKKLSNNDRRWADGREHGHQNGPYIPAELRAEGFFPELKSVKAAKPHILEASVQTCWIRTGERKESRLVNYSNKGKECHLTRVPTDEFAGTSPASWLLIGMTITKTGIAEYLCLVVDSADEEGSSYIETVLELGSDFECGLFSGYGAAAPAHKLLQDFIEKLLLALGDGSIGKLADSYVFPTTKELAKEAQILYLQKTGRKTLNPYELDEPGNALMQISRDIEYLLFKEHLARRYSAILMQLLAGTTFPPDLKSIVGRLVGRFDDIYKQVMVSAGQRSKSRAGSSFEHHVKRMLEDGGVPFEEQKFIGNQRPDFILPSLKVFENKARKRKDAFILSLKTLLRERWKQVLRENKASDLFLGTVDDSIASASIADMKDHGIYLVVPESMKDSTYTEYADHDNVITFKEFFRTELVK